ncbi:tRNA lysidine(34) synthetase TilS [Arachidicoccus sp.]|uniref:tRNA lysidine(34) synthetase TilS n=1 Tax=Arachidicoccus sp. TaxID=1872624 RepID=UPI003D20502A
MNLISSFQTQLQQDFPYVSKKHTKLLLAVSGGVDSVVLVDLFARLGFNFVIAHCNFHLRGEESNRDEIFVKTIAEIYQKEIFIQHFETEKMAEIGKTSIEETARNLRYNWFVELLHKEDIFPLPGGDVQAKEEFIQNKFIVTAHHANDTIETLLMNFFRGTGIGGLHGIPSRNKDIIRPLLFAKREEIVAYAKAHHLNWVEDSSNQSELYTRNFFRLNFLPAVQQYFPRVEDNLLNNIDRFKEAEILYKQAVDRSKKKLLQQKGKEFLIPVLLLKKIPAQQTLLWEIAKSFSFSQAQIPEIIKLLEATSGAHIDSGTHRIFKNRNHLVITPLAEALSQQVLINKEDKNIHFEDGRIQFSFLEKNLSIDKDSGIAMLDADTVKFPLLLRKWKTGDYFYPLGMKKKKKLSRFFIDQKLSLSQKEHIWVLESDKKIVWIVGLRIDDRFKILPSSKNILRIAFK